jgi:hypothetical protein
VYERLVENWLDSASERSYQAPFCQMLAARGHRIMHSTRHSQIELGKDILTIAPDGVPCAYQLKGQPGTRLTYQEFTHIHDQLRSLIDLAIAYPGIPPGQHRAYLVTNGLIEEEAGLAIEQMNAGYVDAGFPNRRLEVIQRGELLAMARELGESLWPTEIPQIHLLLEMLVEDGLGRFPVDRGNRMLSEVLGLGAGPRPGWPAPEIRRRITSAALLTSLSLKRFEAKDNHYAILGAWVQFALAAIGTCERFNVSFNNNARTAVEIATTSIRDALIDLARESLERDPLVEGDVLWDAAFYRARYTLILGLLSILWFWNEEVGWPDDLPRDDVEAFLLNGRPQLYLWGEAAIPQMLAYYWFLRRKVAGQGVDALLFTMLYATVRPGADGTSIGLPSPYWGFEDVARHALTPVLGLDGDEMREEATGLVSYYAESLLHLAVRTNWKAECKRIWPDFTRMQSVEFEPGHLWQYCLSHTDSGNTRQVQPPTRKEWADLVEEARSVKCDSAPQEIVDRPFLLVLFIMLFPHRGRHDVVRRLSWLFNRSWMIPPPIE